MEFSLYIPAEMAGIWSRIGWRGVLVANKGFEMHITESVLYPPELSLFNSISRLDIPLKTRMILRDESMLMIEWFLLIFYQLVVVLPNEV